MYLYISLTYTYNVHCRILRGNVGSGFQFLIFVRYVFICCMAHVSIITFSQHNICIFRFYIDFAYAPTKCETPSLHGAMWNTETNFIFCTSLTTPQHDYTSDNRSKQHKQHQQQQLNYRNIHFTETYKIVTTSKPSCLCRQQQQIPFDFHEKFLILSPLLPYVCTKPTLNVRTTYPIAWCMYIYIPYST